MARRTVTDSSTPRAPTGEFALAKISAVLFALIICGLAVIILSVIAGDNEIITRLAGRRISTAALAIAATSGVILIFVTILADMRHKRQIG